MDLRDPAEPVRHEQKTDNMHWDPASRIVLYIFRLFMIAVTLLVLKFLLGEFIWDQVFYEPLYLIIGAIIAVAFELRYLTAEVIRDIRKVIERRKAGIKGTEGTDTRRLRGLLANSNDPEQKKIIQLLATKGILVLGLVLAVLTQHTEQMTLFRIGLALMLMALAAQIIILSLQWATEEKR